VDLLTPVKRFDRFQQAHPAWAVPMAVIKKFADDQAGGLAALVAYYAFFSIFPLLLVFTTILAFVLQGNEELYNDVTTSVLAQFPVVGEQLQAQALTGKVTALVLGVLTSLWGGLGVTQAAQNAFDKVWAVPFKDRRDFLRKRLRGLLLLMCLGVLFVLSAVITGLVTTTFHGTLVKIVGYAITLTVNFWFYMAAFRFLTAPSVPTRSLWLGAAVGAVFLTILQLVGSIYIQHVIKRASNTYGTFATVIGLLVWLHLIAQLTMLATETNTVVARRLWPRSLLGPPQSTADKETLRALAEMEARDQRESVEVRFEDS
jgi:YihY family inner membrane protein